MQTPNAPWYRHAPIATLPALARALGLPLETIHDARAAIPKSYRRQEQPKRGGGIRVTYSVAKPLKLVQGRILHRLLRHMNVPDYLLGGRPGKDYLANVQCHCGAKILFGEYVASFFPSINHHHVQDIFQRLMRFSPTVTECLADLCTFHDQVPQGARTSGDLANLVLWRSEPTLVAQFQSRGLHYSRFVDDVYISARHAIPAGEKTWIVGQVHAMFMLAGFRAKRKKHEINGSGAAMRVHRVSINAGRPSIDAAARSQIRAAIHQLESKCSVLTEETATVVLAHLRGRVARLKRLHAVEYDQLHRRLNALSTSSVAGKMIQQQSAQIRDLP